MKHFLLTNWYKIILSLSAFILSVSILLLALKSNTAYAGGNNPKFPDEQDYYIVAGGAYAYKIQWNPGLVKWEIKSIGKLP